MLHERLVKLVLGLKVIIEALALAARLASHTGADARPLGADLRAGRG